MAEIESRWDTAAAACLTHWGMTDSAIRLVSHSENLVYRVDADTGTYGLRVHRPGYHTRAELLSEQQWTTALDKAGSSVPTARPTRGGDGLASIVIAGERPRAVSLVKWVEGDLLGSRLQTVLPKERLRLIRGCGCTMARLHAAASGWTTPTGFRRVHWDADGLMGYEPAWGRFWEAEGLNTEQTQLLMLTRDMCKRRLDRLPRGVDGYSLIHADMHPYNMIVSDAGIHVIDFDDAGFGWHAYDIAVALYNFRRDEAFAAVRAAFLDGYRELRPLGDATAEMLDLFFLVRSLVWLGWVNDRPDLFDAERRGQAIDLVCTEAAAFEQLGR